MDAYEFVKLQAERSPKDMETTYFMNYDGKNGDWKIIGISRNITGRMKSSAAHGCKAIIVSLNRWFRKEFRYNASLSYYDRTVSYWNQTTNVYKAYVLPSKRRN